MTEFVHYFNHLPDSARIYILIACLLGGSILDLFFGFAQRKSYFKHFLFNARFMLTAAPIQYLFSILLVYCFSKVEQQHFGAFYWVGNWGEWKSYPLLVLFITILYLDFGEYVYHLIMHQYKRTWMFHAIHHADMDLDTSTTLREHPGESTIRMAFMVLMVSLGGIPFWAFICRQCIQIGFNIFAHSTFRFNPKLDRVLAYIFITPNTHQVHHHNKEPFTNTNYGDIFSVWDHLFGTYQFVETHEELNFGLDSFPSKEETENFGDMLRIPFGKYRPKPE